MQVDNVPADILKNAVSECNGRLDTTSMEGAAALGTFKCASVGIAAETGSFLMQFAETR